MTSDAKNKSPMTAVDCEVIHKETANDYIVRVRAEDGKTVNIVTTLPDVQKGHKGKLLTLDGKTIFLREPYDGFDF